VNEPLGSNSLQYQQQILTESQQIKTKFEQINYQTQYNHYSHQNSVYNSILSANSSHENQNSSKQYEHRLPITSELSSSNINGTVHFSSARSSENDQAQSGSSELSKVEILNQVILNVSNPATAPSQLNLNGFNLNSNSSSDDDGYWSKQKQLDSKMKLKQKGKHFDCFFFCSSFIWI
jgi:hypothetical protein